jgi:tetratricopeptide (TPR) repeat protein
MVPNRRGDLPGDYGTVIGPGGIVPPAPPPVRRAEVPKKPALTPQERAAEIRKALVPKPPLAVARRHALDDLYGKLAAATDADEAKGLATLIANIWMRSGSDTASLLMQRASEAQARKDYPVALDLLDKLVALQPAWAEAWNKRASVRYLAGDLDGSMADVEHVLKLEPKHFGALEGMAMILQRTGLDKQALEVYRRALAVYPHQPDVQQLVDKLTLQVEGQGI